MQEQMKTTETVENCTGLKKNCPDSKNDRPLKIEQQMKNVKTAEKCIETFTDCEVNFIERRKG